MYTQYFIAIKKAPKSGALAEEEGFEPPDLLQSTVFKTAAIDHSAIPPGAKVKKNEYGDFIST